MTSTRSWRPLALALPLLIGLPLLGVALTGQPLAPFLAFPPLTRAIVWPAFSWPIFIGLALLVIAVTAPLEIRVLRSRRAIQDGAAARNARRWPWWGWAGLLLTLASWALSWYHADRAAPVQRLIFTPLWVGYIVVVNALTFRRTGHCLLMDHRAYLVRLAGISAVFWWYFEYLNRFSGNWYYLGTAGLSGWRYLLLATLPFATVLPAVMSTYEWLDTQPRVGAGLNTFVRVAVRRPRRWAALIGLVAAVGLMGIGAQPVYCFPLLWIAPLGLLVALQRLDGQPTLFHALREGHWRRLYVFALAALVCGLFWELWNGYSVMKWMYTVPFVDRFHVMEMPVLGFAGYLPFGLECAVIADLARPPARRAADGTTRTSTETEPSCVSS